MNYKQYRSAIKTIGLSQRKTAKFLGVAERTSRRWALGEGPIPEAVAKLLRLMVLKQIKPEEVQ